MYRAPRDDVDARWGEMDDPDEFAICLSYAPNPFKKGFCKNCQRQHLNIAGMGIEEVKVTNKINPTGKPASRKQQSPPRRQSPPPPRRPPPPPSRASIENGWL